MKNRGITLRAMEPSDVEVMYRWENDTTLWSVGDVVQPFSRVTLAQFIETSGDDIFRTRQLRLIIDLCGQAIGAVDLFDFQPLHRRAGVGVLIFESTYRGHGYAAQAVELLKSYAFGRLGLHQLWTQVPTNNVASGALFCKCGFRVVGRFEQWMRQDDGIYQDVDMYQCLAPGASLLPVLAL